MLTRRNLIKSAAIATGSLVLAGCSGTDDSASTAEAADLVLTNGTIQTMADDNAVVEALAVKDGSIVFAGTAADAEAYVGDATQTIDLEGAFVSPGFIDAHTHDVQAILAQMYQCYLTETEATVEAYQAAIREYAEANPDLEVIYGGAIDLNAFEGGAPTAAFIDEVVSDRPVVLYDASLHGRVVNTKALEVAGITSETEPPAGGMVYTDSDGNPTGYLSDATALLGDLDGMTYTADQYEEAFRAYQEHANSLGITGIQLGGNEVAAEDQWGVHKKLEQAGELNLRIGDTIWAEGYADGGYNEEAAERDIAILDAAQDKNSDFVKINMLKMKFDGVPEGKSAYLLEPYDEAAEMDADYVGTLNGDATAIQDYVVAVNKAGYQVQVHAMGDGAVQVALDAYEYAVGQNGEGDYRNVVTHVTLISDDDKQRMAELGVIAAMQPMWFYYDPMFSPLEEQNFGSERFGTEYHIRDMVDAGITITGSADFPITEDNPLDGIEVGCTQCSPFEGEEDDDAYLRNADQTVDVMEALRWYTVNGAYQMKMDDLIGTLEVGKKADLVVLSQDITSCESKKINEATVLYTISDGRIVYQA